MRAIKIVASDYKTEQTQAKMDLAKDIDMDKLMKSDDIQTSMAELRKICVLAGIKQNDIQTQEVTIAMQQALRDFKKDKNPGDGDSDKLENISENSLDEENDGLINVPQSKSDIKFAKQKNDLRDSMMSINSDIAIDAPNRLANSMS